MEKKKILLSVTYLKEIGGISTAAYNLINEINNKYDVTLCVPCDFISEKYVLPSNIRIIRGSEYLCDIITDRKFLKHQTIIRKFYRNARRIFNHYFLKGRLIPKKIEGIKIDGKFDVAIAFADFTYDSRQRKCFDYDLVLKQVNAKKKIAWIHNDPDRLGWTKNLIEKRLVKFDAVVNVSEYCKLRFDSLAPEFASKSFVVYNMYDIDKINMLSEMGKNPYLHNGKIHFVTVARIQREQKRIDRIIETCKKLVDAGYDNFDWTLVGSSPEIQLLKDYTIELGLSSVIYFAGLQKNPYPYFKYADASILASDYEGLSMTIKESQILNTPTLVTNFGAAKESIEIDKQGLICEKTDVGFYDMIKSILDNPTKLKEYKKHLINNKITNDLALKQFNSLVN